MKTFKLIYAFHGGEEKEIIFKGSYKKAYEQIIKLSKSYYIKTNQVIYYWIEEDNHIIKHGFITDYLL